MGAIIVEMLWLETSSTFTSALKSKQAAVSAPKAALGVLVSQFVLSVYFQLSNGGEECSPDGLVPLYGAVLRRTCICLHVQLVDFPIEQ